MRDQEKVSPSTVAGAGRGRRLSDKILVAFHQACDQGDLEVADALLRVLGMMAERQLPIFDQRRQESLVGAYRRLWELRNGGAEEEAVANRTEWEEGPGSGRGRLGRNDR